VKLGFLTSVLDDLRKAARLGFPAVELHCAALADPRRGPVPADRIEHALGLCAETGVEITALAYYGLAFAPPPEHELLAVYENVFATAEALGVETVASMSGFDANLDWSGNLDLFARRFAAIAAAAEARGRKLALENWMSVEDHLPFKPTNMGGSPATWHAWFESVPSPTLGLEFDPSHLYWQGIDPLRALTEFADRVHHVHAKDVEMLPELRYQWGINCSPYRFRIPGYGEIAWPPLISALVEAGYDGGVAIEHEDPVFWDGALSDEGLLRGLHVLRPLVHPEGVRT
jgi:sugar phosphate isomerase/epimerase